MTHRPKYLGHVNLYVRNADERAKAEKEASANRTVIGGAAELVEQIGRYGELGVDEFAIGDYTFGETPQQRTDMYQTFHSDVLSQLL